MDDTKQKCGHKNLTAKGPQGLGMANFLYCLDCRLWIRVEEIVETLWKNVVRGEPSEVRRPVLVRKPTELSPTGKKK